MPRAFELAASQPWLMLPGALDNLLTIADRMGDPAALETRTGMRLDNSRTVSVRNGVAIIPVVGPVFRYLQAALDDPKISAIILNIDSPGGVAAGINELADQIHAARDHKRIVAYIGGTGASAAYWIASAASEIVIDETEIVSRNAPNKRVDLSTEEGRAKVGETVDAMGDVFVAKVARNLGVEPERVPEMGDFGGLRVGAAAVESGLAHRLGSLETLLTELAKPAATQPRKYNMTTVSSTAELREALAAGTDPQIIEIAQANQPDLESIRTQSREEGATAERQRITGINAMASKGFETEIAAAIEAGTTVEATALQLFKAAQDRGISLHAIKADATGASTSTPAGDAAQGERKAVVNAIVEGASRR